MRALHHIWITAIACCFSVIAFAQPDDEVIIITNANRTVEPANRMSGLPKILDTVFPVPNTNYPLLAINYEPYFDLQRIAPASVNLNQKLPQLYNGYAKIGIGSVLMPLGEVYYNNTRSRKLNYGIHAQHLSSWGKMRDVAPATFDRTSARGFIGMTEKKYDWGAEAFYKNQGLHFYGFPNENAPKDSIAQRFNTISGKAFYSRHVHDSLGVNWKGTLEYRHFNDRKPQIDSLSDWRARENYFGATANAWMRWGDEIFTADVDLKWNGYQYGVNGDTLNTALDSGFVSNNTLLSLRPSITTYSKNKRLKAKIGVDLTISSRDAVKAYLYPKAEVKYSLFDDILIPYLQVNGGMKQQSFKSLTDDNEFILSHVTLRNEHKAIEGIIGIKGTLSKRIGFNLSAGFANVKDKALFVTDTLYSNSNRFSVIYDTMNIATIEGSLTYQYQEKTKIDLIGRYNSYNAFNNSYAWNLPTIEFILRGSYNLYDKFIISADVHLEGGRKALVYVQEDGVVEENNQLAKNLGFIADANIGVEYRYNKRISAFLNFNNVAAQRYRRWYNYPVQGFQVMGGVTFRF